MHNQIFSIKKSSRSIGRRNDKPSPLAGEGRLPLSGGDVERSETEGVGRHRRRRRRMRGKTHPIDGMEIEF